MNFLTPFNLLLTYLLLGGAGVWAAVEEEDDFRFDDTPLEEVITYPEWFKQSFLALDEDLQEATDAGKSGIAVYFGQKRCAYCKAPCPSVSYFGDAIIGVNAAG